MPATVLTDWLRVAVRIDSSAVEDTTLWGLLSRAFARRFLDLVFDAGSACSGSSIDGASRPRAERVERLGDFARSSVGLRGSMSGRGLGSGTMSGDGRYSLFHNGLSLGRGGVARAETMSETKRGGS